jgi:hypothetical protein
MSETGCLRATSMPAISGCVPSDAEPQRVWPARRRLLAWLKPRHVRETGRGGARFATADTCRRRGWLERAICSEELPLWHMPAIFVSKSMAVARTDTAAPGPKADSEHG